MNNISIGLICAAIGAVATLITVKRAYLKDAREETRGNTEIVTKIDYISKGVDDIRIDIKAQDRRINDISERVVRIEESAKSAHKRIDELEK